MMKEKEEGEEEVEEGEEGGQARCARVISDVLPLPPIPYHGADFSLSADASHGEPVTPKKIPSRMMMRKMSRPP